MWEAATGLRFRVSRYFAKIPKTKNPNFREVVPYHKASETIKKYFSHCLLKTTRRTGCFRDQPVFRPTWARKRPTIGMNVAPTYSRQQFLVEAITRTKERHHEPLAEDHSRIPSCLYWPFLCVEQPLSRLQRARGRRSADARRAQQPLCGWRITHLYAGRKLT